MANETAGASATASDALIPATNLFTVGAELLSEVQKIIGKSRVRSLRLTIGHRVVKEIPISPLTAIGTVAVVLAAVILSNLRVEVVQDAGGASGAAAPPAGGVS